MQKILPFVVALFVATALSLFAQDQQFETDTIPTSEGDLVITFLRHSTLMFTFNGKCVDWFWYATRP